MIGKDKRAQLTKQEERASLVVYGFQFEFSSQFICFWIEEKQILKGGFESGQTIPK